MNHDINRPEDPCRALRSDNQDSPRVKKSGAQITDMDERMRAAFLCVLALGGDGSAFRRLYEQHSEIVHNCILALLFLRMRQRHLEDLTQDAWLLIWKHLDRYRPAKGSFPAFARYWARIAWLRWLDRRRLPEILFEAWMEMRRRYPDKESEIMDQLDNVVPVHPFADRWDREALAAKADKAIGQLLRTKSDLLEILSVLLTMFPEWPPREIAAKLSRSTLSDVTDFVATLVIERTGVSPKKIEAHFRVLRRWLPAKVEDVMKGQRHVGLLQRHRGARMGDLLVQDFYTGRVKGGRPAEIVKWRAAGITRTRQLAGFRLAAKTSGPRKRQDPP